MAETSKADPPRARLLTGSITTRVGALSWISCCIIARWSSNPRVVGRSQWKCSSPRSTQPVRSSPMDDMLRWISASDSSKLKNSTTSPRLQAASAKLAPIVVLPVPDDPLTRIPLPRNTPSPPSMSSNPGTPVETRSALTCLFRPSEVIGSTSSPWAPIRNGYSFLPWFEPRYFSTSSRLVATSWTTRSSSTTTQSERYSSMPCRVSESRPRSPVITVVSPWSLSSRNSRCSSDRTRAGLLKAANSASTLSMATLLAPNFSTAQASRTISASRLNSPVSTAWCSRLSASTSSRPSASNPSMSKSSELTSATTSARFCSNVRNTPRSPYSVTPLTRNCNANRLLPEPGGPHTKLGRPAGNPPPVISSKPTIPVGLFGSCGPPLSPGFSASVLANTPPRIEETHRYPLIVTRAPAKQKALAHGSEPLPAGPT